MTRVHDMGGTPGFGRVHPEPDEPVFHAPWERRALALTLAMGATGTWNIDMSRHARESLPPAEYLASSYYAIWLAALERLLVERGLASRAEIETGHALEAARPVARVLGAAHVAPALAQGAPARRDTNAKPRYAIGQRVRARNLTLNASGHTRLPRYVQGHAGTVVALHGAHVYPDRHATGNGPPFDEAPEWLYTVQFNGSELWGGQAEPGLEVSVDAFEPYLEAAQ